MSDNLTVECVSSGKITSTGTVTAATQSVLLGVVLVNGGAAATAVITDAAGNELTALGVPGTTATTTGNFLPKFSISCFGTMTITLSGASAYAYVYYRVVRS